MPLHEQTRYIHARTEVWNTKINSSTTTMVLEQF